ncbi:metal-dependent hydrolase [Mycobacteroides abscessus]|uniref:metal-dependent hydrolase n=1 Tax=Mycobacteroides abscessus TaxID=36809 RepID=UPI000D9E3960|nr:metal-dependent hydrolase [Mycobacteroides abscessus]SPX88010.1 metal-dependent hydrolase [Mycobacteroides abscessus]
MGLRLASTSWPEGLFDQPSVAVRPRDVHFDTTATPLHWIPGEPAASHMINAFNLIFPTVERFFCRVFEKTLPFVRDEKLREDMVGFIGQEAIHAQAHDRVLHEYFSQHGVTDVDTFIELTEWLERRVYPLLDQLSGNALLRALRPMTYGIAVIEHYTSLLGDWALNDAHWDELGADPVMADLYRWHGAEEVEHRSVAFDVATYLGLSWWRRVLIVIPAGLMVYPILLVGGMQIAKRDPSFPKMGYVRFFLQLRKAAKRGAVPSPGYIFRQIWHLVGRNYSPQQFGDTAQAVAYIAQSPAVRALA